MSAQFLYAVGTRLLGIYFLVTGMAGLPGTLIAYDTAHSAPHASHTLWSVVAVLLHAGIYLASGAYLLFRHRPAWVQQDVISMAAGLPTGLRLLGVWWVVGALASALKWISLSTFTEPGWAMFLTELLTPVVYLLCGGVLVFKADALARCLGGAQPSSASR